MNTDEDGLCKGVTNGVCERCAYGVEGASYICMGKLGHIVIAIIITVVLIIAVIFVVVIIIVIIETKHTNKQPHFYHKVE